MNTLKKINKFIYLLLFSLVIYAHSSSAEQREVKIATLDKYEPFCYFDKDNNFTGYSYEVLKKAFESQGYKVVIQVSPWIRAVDSLNTKRADLLFPVGVNSQRLRIYNYSNNPVNSIQFVVYSHTSSNKEIQTIKDLKNTKVALRKGFNFGDKWNQEKSSVYTTEVKNINQGFNLLEAGRVDFFLTYFETTLYYLKSKGLEYRFKKNIKIGENFEYVVGLKENEKSLEYLKAYDLGIEYLKKTKQLNKIKKKWKID